MKPDHSHPAFGPDCNTLIFQSGHFTNGKRLNLMMVDLDKVVK
jgi:oligogalacturonide lyase